MLYQTLYYPDNPTFEYQKRGKIWLKRKKGSQEKWYPVPPNSNSVLDGYFSSKKRFGYQYSALAKTGAIVLVLVGSYFIVKKWNLRK
jgi:hypothetical protein